MESFHVVHVEPDGRKETHLNVTRLHVGTPNDNLAASSVGGGWVQVRITDVYGTERSASVEPGGSMVTGLAQGDTIAILNG